MNEEEKDLNKIFNLPQVSEGEIPPDVLAEKNLNKFAEDFNTARNNILDVLQKATAASGELYELGFSSQHPRLWEVFCKSIQVQMDASNNLLNLQKTAREISKNTREDPKVQQNIQNNLYIGTSGDLLKLIKKAQENRNEDI